MMLKNTLVDALYEIWPMVFIFSVILSTVRITYLYYRGQKFVLYKEFLSLLFIVYILILFYIVTFQDDSGLGDSNFVPFKEMFRYDIGSRLFFKNIIGNLLLFIPFGIFISYYIKSYRFWPILILSFISSLAIEFTQYKIGRVFDIDDIMLNIFGAIIGYILFIAFASVTKRLPKLMRREWFINLIFVILIILVILYFLNFDTAIFGGILCQT